MLKMEALYALGRFEKVREEAVAARDHGFEDPTHQELVRWWAGTD